MNKYVAYYRVSTSKQVNSNFISLGIEAQRSSVHQFINYNDGELIGEFSEVESGKVDSRPILMEAIRQAEVTGSVLIIAKLDRLSRNVSFLFQLKERLSRSNIMVRALDLPDFSTITLGVLAVYAEHEREILSLRTKQALAELKKQGKVLGTPANLTSEAQTLGREKIKRNARMNICNRQVTPIIVDLREKGVSYNEIAKYLNELGYLTRTGKCYRGCTVLMLYNRHISEKTESDDKKSEKIIMVKVA